MLPFFRFWFVAIIVIQALSSCRKLVTYDLPTMENKPVINSFFNNNEPIRIHLSLTEGFKSTDFVVINDAEIVIEEDFSIKDTLNNLGDGMYISSIKAKQNSKYKLKVLHRNNEINAQSSLPVKQEIVEYKHINNAGKDEEGISYPAIKLKFTNNPNEVLYFEIVIKLFTDGNPEIWNEETESWNVAPGLSYKIPELINITDPLILNNGLPIPVFSNELIKGDSYTITINYKTGSYSSDETGNHTLLYPLVVELRSVSYEYFKYVNQLYLYEIGRYPYVFGDVARTYPLYSNVENGYGIFAGYTSSNTNVIYPNKIDPN